MELTIFSGDNGKLVSSDYVFSEYGELTFMLQKMPKQDSIIKHFSQYSDQEYRTGCTIMSGINNFATINNYDFTKEEIKSVYAQAISKGWSPGKAWSRSEGFINIMQRWNKKFPDNQALIFTDTIMSDSFNTYIDKFGIAGVSINVDSNYRRDVRDNLVLDSNGTFVLITGHATNIMKSNEKYICVDSIPQNYTNKINEPMLYIRGIQDKINKLIQNYNMRKDCHLIIMQNWLKQTDPVEKERLQTMKSKLEQVIQLNSDLWNLTTSSKEKDERKRENNWNRGKLAIVNSMLK